MPLEVGDYVVSAHTGEWHCGLTGVIVAVYGERTPDYDVYFFNHGGMGHSGSGRAFPDLDGNVMTANSGHYWISQRGHHLVQVPPKARRLKSKEWPPKKKIVYKGFSATTI